MSDVQRKCGKTCSGVEDRVRAVGMPRHNLPLRGLPRRGNNDQIELDSG